MTKRYSSRAEIEAQNIGYESAKRAIGLLERERVALRAMLNRCEFWLGTHPEGKKMQREIQKLLEQHKF